MDGVVVIPVSCRRMREALSVGDEDGHFPFSIILMDTRKAELVDGDGEMRIVGKEE